MPAPMKPLADDASRRNAIAVHDRAFLVEAGAGSGKPAVLAGRIAMMLAEGIAPKAIAAVTFTELAASELLIRVREFVGDLTAGRVPTELRVALPNGAFRCPAIAGTSLQQASAIDEITCSTIHGFCQRLIKPYPVEADIDPGATVMDRNQSDLAFVEIIETWLREELAGEGDARLLVEMVLHEPVEDRQPHPYDPASPTSAAGASWSRSTHLPEALAPLVKAFSDAADEFSAFLRGCSASEVEAVAIAAHFAKKWLRASRL